MIGACTWGVLEDSKLTVSALLADREEWAVLLREGVARLVCAGAGNIGTDLRTQILTTSWHRKAWDTVGHPCLNDIISGPRWSLPQVLHTAILAEAKFRDTHQLIIGKIVPVVATWVLLLV